jgi:putative ABC transport system permease protein
MDPHGSNRPRASAPFDLDAALAVWRRGLANHRALLPDDLDELEQHVRDQVADLVAGGATEEAAYRRALTEMGFHPADEYRKVYWGKVRRGGLRHEVRGRLTLLRNDAKVALRHLLRHRGYAAINVAGLAIGLACCTVALTYTADERAYDRHLPALDRLYRVHETFGDTGVEWASTPPAAADALAEAFGDRVEVARLRRRGTNVTGPVTIRHEDRRFIEPGLFYADSTVFDVLGYELLAGDPRHALTAPDALVLTEAMARKYFGGEAGNAVGQTLLVADEAYTVMGVLRDPPARTHLPLDFIASLPSIWNPGPSDAPDYWRYDVYYTYVKVDDPALVPALRAHLEAQHRVVLEAEAPSTFPFVPVARIHLHSHAERELFANGDARTLSLLLLVSALVLGLAGINFVNLATARAAERAREVGVRKALGAGRTQLARLFVGEAVLLALLAAALALGLVLAAAPFLQDVLGRPLALGVLMPWWVLPVLVGLAVTTGLVAGAYPALYLSALQPVGALRGATPAGRGRLTLRHALVVAQFGVSTVLLIGAAVVARQVAALVDAHLGFARDHVVVLPALDPGKLDENYTALADALRALPAVRGVARSESVPGDRIIVEDFAPEGQAAADSLVGLRQLRVDETFVSTFGLELAQGRNFDGTVPRGGTRSYLVNEAAVRALGWTDPIGRRVRVGEEGAVIGVVRDFGFSSLRGAVEPLVLTNEARFKVVSVRLGPGDPRPALDAIERAWARYVPGEPFAYRFLDDTLAALYAGEARLRSTFRVFGAIALLLAGLGLFGLSAYTTARRTKEVGVRKVLGASTPRLVLLLMGDFARPVVAAFALAAPVGYLLMERWLEGFAYRIALGPGLFVAVGSLLLGLGLLAVAAQTLRAATADPVQALRTE